MNEKREAMTSSIESVSCNLCHSQASRIIYSKFDLNLVKCENCRLVYAHPRPLSSDIRKRYESEAFFREHLEALKATRNSYSIDFIRSHYSLFLDLIRAYFKPGKKLLDIGCGAGFFLKAAQEEGWKAEGIEISTLAVRYARNIVGINVHNGSLKETVYLPQTFDIITLFDLLEHLLDPLETLKDIHRILKEGGIVIISTPDFNSLSRFLYGRDWAVLSPAEHLYNFSEKTLRKLLTRTGFRILGIRNLLVFNPDCTHDKNKTIHTIWKKAHRRLEEMNKIKNLHGFEYEDVLTIAQGKSASNSGITRTKQMIRKVYRRRAKTWLRGDILVAVAKKNEATQG